MNRQAVIAKYQSELRSRPAATLERRGKVVYLPAVPRETDRQLAVAQDYVVAKKRIQTEWDIAKFESRCGLGYFAVFVPVAVLSYSFIQYNDAAGAFVSGVVATTTFLVGLASHLAGRNRMKKLRAVSQSFTQG